MFHRRCPGIASWMGLVVPVRVPVRVFMVLVRVFVVAVYSPKSCRSGKKGGRGQESQVHGDVQKSRLRFTEM